MNTVNYPINPRTQFVPISVDQTCTCWQRNREILCKYKIMIMHQLNKH